MRKVFFLCAILITASWAIANENAFQQVLSLQGTWEGKLEGETIQLVYEPISDRAAMMEKMTFLSDGSSMTTVYYPADGKLMATHFCKAKNQPRLVSIPADDGTLRFEFMDGAKPDERHLTALQLRLISENQLEQTVRFNGNPDALKVLYTRKK